jgi:hypothetical protein
MGAPDEEQLREEQLRLISTIRELNAGRREMNAQLREATQRIIESRDVDRLISALEAAVELAIQEAEDLAYVFANLPGLHPPDTSTLDAELEAFGRQSDTDEETSPSPEK